MSLTLAVIDDHLVFREAFSAMLRAQPDLEVVAEGSDAREAFSIVENQRPDVVLLDISLPGLNGVEAAREIAVRRPSQKILFLSMHDGADMVARAMAAGGAGYVLKSEPSAVVLEAIRAVGRGEEFLPARFSRQLLELRRSRRDPEEAHPLSSLSPREREVFDLLARGETNSGVGQRLHISIKTAETHRAHILKKLAVHSLAGLVRYAATNHLL